MARFALLFATFFLLLPAVAEAKSIKIYTLRGEALTSVKRQAAPRSSSRTVNSSSKPAYIRDNRSNCGAPINRQPARATAV